MARAQSIGRYVFKMYNYVLFLYKTVMLSLCFNTDHQNLFWGIRMMHGSFLRFLIVVMSVCGVLQAAEQGSSAPRVARPCPTWLTQSTLYQIWPRGFTPEGTLAAATKKLPHVAELGISIIYMSPIFLQDDDPRREFWSDRQKASQLNNPHNPYRIKDYFKIDPEYGTDADLKAFVAEAHRLNMRVILDLVYLHCGPTAVAVTNGLDWVERDAHGVPVPASWHFPKLNFKSASLREHLFSNMTYWVQQFNVDGYRCDVAPGVPLDFWEESRRRLEKIRPDIIMLSEGERTADQCFAFDLNYNFTWLRTLQQVFEKGASAATMQTLWQKQRTNFPAGARFIRYTENHDIVHDELRAEIVFGERGAAAMMVFCFTIDGVPMLYNGQEFGDCSPQSIYAQWPIRWESKPLKKAQKKWAFYKRLCQLRKEESALATGAVAWLTTDRPDDVLAYTREDPAATVMTLISLSNRKVLVTVECDRMGERLLGDGAVLTLRDNKVHAELAPFGYCVTKTKK